MTGILNPYIATKEKQAQILEAMVRGEDYLLRPFQPVLLENFFKEHASAKQKERRNCRIKRVKEWKI